MTEKYDAIIVGGGHNGLTTAGYLGKAGLKTIVLERLPQVGGAVVTEEIHPGYRISAVSYVVSLLRPEVIKDLELKKHGFEMLKMDGTLSICNDDHLFLTGDEAHDRKEIGRFSSLDYDAMQQFDAMVQSIGTVIRNQMLREPPKLAAGLSDLTALARMGWDIRKLTPELRHRLFQMLFSSAHDFIQRWFDSSMIKSMYAAACFSGNFASLRQPGSAIPFFHSAIGEIEGEKGAWRLVKGGMGGLTQAMAGFALSKGVEIRTDAAVAEIIVDGGRAAGVRLEDGEILNGRCVLANTDPKRTFLKLMDPKHLDADFVRDIRQIRMGHSSLRLNLALKGLPDIKFFPAGSEGAWHRSDITMHPDYDAMEANYFAAAAGRLPDEPRLEITIPSTLDDSLAPPGRHVMSILAKYYPYQLVDGVSWDDIKEDVADRIIAYMARAMPNLPDLIIGRQMLSPLDLETIYGLTESDIFHGRHDMDQLFSLRPHPKAAQYRTPVQNLYLCGSGAHPGGGVSGAPGYNAARRVIADLKRR
ncbi:MAG: NAD(P)/FAD-dependent oxidoreductase [Deltaproteobacteria bacterium]|nr:NAD(P)/FAD-dependent oxidoreductase [Deltaproteobacteria bacterium]MBW2677835.1 NAD(P)/FAD-dependent oxidoreductase [Deltaproteobacteria bacterium]